MKLKIDPVLGISEKNNAALITDIDSNKTMVLACEQALETATEIALAMNSFDQREDALQSIVRWSEAYPLSIFPEPDLKKARRLLEAGGITLDAVSAHAMRHVVEQVGQIARRGLK